MTEPQIHFDACVYELLQYVNGLQGLRIIIRGEAAPSL